MGLYTGVNIQNVFPPLYCPIVTTQGIEVYGDD